MSDRVLHGLLIFSGVCGVALCTFLLMASSTDIPAPPTWAQLVIIILDGVLLALPASYVLSCLGERT